MNYFEDKDTSKIYKQNYLDGLKQIVSKRKKDIDEKRDAQINNFMDNREYYRNELKNYLGWPLNEKQDKTVPKARFEKLSEEDGYCIYRAEFEILDGLVLSGLFFKTTSEGKRPLVIVQHGGEGTPELISGFYGNTANYNNMLERVIKHRVHAFAPQLLLWSHKEYNLEFNRTAIDVILKNIGSSITAIEVYGITKIIDYFENQSYVSNFGMVGLSYGGFYTLFTSAIDERILSAISCSYFGGGEHHGFLDWKWFEYAEKFSDAQVACLTYPRKMCLQMGNKDQLFNYKDSEQTFEIIKKICHKVGTDWIKLVIFDGDHEFCMFDDPIEQLINDILF